MDPLAFLLPTATIMWMGFTGLVMPYLLQAMDPVAWALSLGLKGIVVIARARASRRPPLWRLVALVLRVSLIAWVFGLLIMGMSGWLLEAAVGLITSRWGSRAEFWVLCASPLAYLLGQSLLEGLLYRRDQQVVTIRHLWITVIVANVVSLGLFLWMIRGSLAALGLFHLL